MEMKTEVFTRMEQGFAVTGLRTATAELAMVPALGGRIISLRSRRTAREWCWHQPRADWLWANQPGDNFGLSPQAGVDECVPSVAGCTWRGRTIPDHGEVWAEAWTLNEVELAAHRLSTTVPLRISPLVFQRIIWVKAAGSFVFDYALTNRSTGPEEFMWCLHPLFTIVDGDQLELPAEVTTLRLNGGRGDRPINFGDTWSYPEPFPGFRLDRLETPGMPQGCVKGFAGPLQTGRAAIGNDATGDRLELVWDVRTTPYLGLWLNRGHGGFHHVALEPTNAAPDSLRDAVENWRQFATIAAGATVRWSVELRVSSQ
jgi:galactose mutarotase-like enzyme